MPYFAVDAYRDKVYKAYNDETGKRLSGPVNYFSELKKALIHVVSTTDRANGGQLTDVNADFITPTLTEEMLKYAARIKKLYAILGTDKSPQDFSIVCKKWYAQRLIAEFHRETYYRVAPENDEDMLKYIAEKVLPFKDMVTFVRQGTAISQAMCYGSLKYHKDPPTLRPIIGSFAAPTKNYPSRSPIFSRESCLISNKHGSTSTRQPE